MPVATGSKYQRYLASREWALLKEQVRERCGGYCERCQAAPYEATHHLTYERIYREELSDLMAVCNECHEFLSGKSNIDPAGLAFVTTVRFPVEKDGPFAHLIWNNVTDETILPPELRFGDEVYLRWCWDDGCVWCTFPKFTVGEFVNMGLKHG